MKLKEFKELKKEELNLTTTVTIGKVWSRLVDLSILIGAKKSDTEYFDSVYAIKSQPRHNKYQNYKEFPLNEEGFQGAKKYALKLNRIG